MQPPKGLRYTVIFALALVVLLGGGTAHGAGPVTFTLAIQNFQHDTLDPALGEVDDLIYLSPVYDPLVGTAPPVS